LDPEVDQVLVFYIALFNCLHILRLYSFLECHMPHMQKLWIQTMSQKGFLSSVF